MATLHPRTGYSGTRTVTLIKGEQTFVIRYEGGQEKAVEKHLIDMVQRADLNFDWFDAACLSHGLRNPKVT